MDDKKKELNNKCLKYLLLLSIIVHPFSVRQLKNIKISKITFIDGNMMDELKMKK